MENKEEIWKDVLGYEGLYQVSNLGRVRSVGKFREFTHPSGNRCKRFVHGIILRNKLVRGYNTVILCNTQKKNKRICRLVAITFIDNLNNKSQVNHINGVKTDDRIENLEWVTPKENMKHAIDTGLFRHASIDEMTHCKPVICMVTNTIYKSTKLASIANKISEYRLSLILRSKVKNTKPNLIYYETKKV